MVSTESEVGAHREANHTFGACQPRHSDELPSQLGVCTHHTQSPGNDSRSGGSVGHWNFEFEPPYTQTQREFEKEFQKCSKGATFDIPVIGKVERNSGTPFVGVSRVRDPDGLLLLEPFSFDRLKKIRNVV